MEKQQRVEGKRSPSINHLILIIQEKKCFLLFILICPISPLLIYLPALIIFMTPMLLLLLMVAVLVSPSLEDLHFLNQEMFYQLLLQSIKANYALA